MSFEAFLGKLLKLTASFANLYQARVGGTKKIYHTKVNATYTMNPKAGIMVS